jgi:hypothetical protein
MLRCRSLFNPSAPLNEPVVEVERPQRDWYFVDKYAHQLPRMASRNKPHCSSDHQHITRSEQVWFFVKLEPGFRPSLHSPTFPASTSRNQHRGLRRSIG